MSIAIKNKIIVILGPTASGKTGLGVGLAYKFNGEIVSADSRQVYKGMDVGTGKDLNEYVLNSKLFKIPYHLIDVVDPKTEFNLAKYYKLAVRAVRDILKRNKLPLIVGGTGLYLEALVDGYNLSAVKPDKELRKKLEKLSADEVFAELKKIKPKFASRLNESERANKRRLIRYVEIAKGESASGILLKSKKKLGNDCEFLVLGLAWPKEILEKRIYKRLAERLEKENMIGEVERLHREGVSWKRLRGFGLEYKFISAYLNGELEYEEMAEKLNIAIRQFAKRQMTWFKRWEKKGQKIHWVSDKKEAEKLVSKFLK